LATKFDNNVTADLSVGEGALQATVNGSHSKSGETTVKISAGTTFAYLLLKLDWDAKQKKNKTKIDDTYDDQWSFS
jgi:hypothetical protein